MNVLAYYNEIDPFAAQWLRNLIAAGHITPGEVDERSIANVQPDDLRGFTQCHFFAGVGGWSYALRLAGWPDDQPVWTGSCPCQPFSLAGKQAGTADERHLWPEWFRLIRECRPGTIFGEQVASAIGHGWLDLVSNDLETEGYACGPIVLPAGSVGAFHIRQRLWFVADSMHTRWAEWWAEPGNGSSSRSGSELVQSERQRLEGLAGAIADGSESGRIAEDAPGSITSTSTTRELDESATLRRRGGGNGNSPRDCRQVQAEGRSALGFWSDAIWIECKDGKTRPIPPKPEFFPLADGIPARVGRLRAYGNAIVPQIAAEVIKAYFKR